MMKKKDFIEIEFTGRVKDGEIFDSNIEEDLKKANLDFASKPFIFCIGEKMFIEGIDKFLIGKEIGSYEVELNPLDAFGKRNPTLVKIIPLKIFKEQKLNPYPGAVFNFDNVIAKVISVSGGRVITDFNHPLAGKTLIYKIIVKRKVEDLNEKIISLMDFFFKREFLFEVKEKKLIINLKDDEKNFSSYIELLKEKFNEMIGLEIEINEINSFENKNKK